MTAWRLAWSRMSAHPYFLGAMQGLIGAVFVLIPLWGVLPRGLPLLPSGLLASRFVMVLPMLLFVGGWLVAGLPNFNTVRTQPARAVFCASLLAWAGWAILSREWAFVSNFPPTSRNYHPETADSAALQWAIVVMFVVALVHVPPTPRTLIWAFGIGLALHSLIALGQAFAQQSLGLGWLGELPRTPDTRGASVLVAGEWRWLRPYGLLPHANNLAGYLSVTTLYVWAWGVAHGQRAWLPVVSLGAAAVLLTFSRSAWLGLIIALGVLFAAGGAWLWESAARRRYIALSVLLLMGVAALFVWQYRPLIVARTAGLGVSEYTQDAVARGEIESIETRSFSDRAVFSALAWRAIREQPLFGVGVGNLPWKISYYLLQTDYDLRANYVHNVYLAVWGDLGLVGLVCMALALAAGVMGGAWQVWQARGAARLLGGSLLAGAVLLAVVGVFDYYPYALIQFQVLWWGGLATVLSLPAHHDA